jgi:hypothetical protein
MTEMCESNNYESEKNMAKKVLKIIGFVILGIGVCILLGFVVMWLWNWLMPSIFGLGTIKYWQAVGLFALAKLFFGGFGSGGGDDSKKHKKGEIRNEIKSEIAKEFDKEFDKEFRKDYEKRKPQPEKKNDDYDALYEKWWSDKGEKSFESYTEDMDE